MVDSRQVMNFRVHAQQLDRTRGSLAQTAVLDLGVQNTGPDGGAWALAVRGAKADEKDLVLLWTLRAAPHLYRRGDVGQVALAVEPYSEADAGKRIFDASKPLKAAGITNLDALDEVARQMRAIVTRPTAKGDVSTRLATVMADPYLRDCRACQATHLYEQPFRMAAVRAGLELQPNTSPPVLQRIAGFKKAVRPSEKFDVVRGYLRLLGPATPRHVAEFLDAPLKDVQARWPEDVVEVTVGREKRSILAADEAALEADSPVTRLLGPYDLFLQARDRSTIVPDAAHAKELWPVLGRPGAVLVDGELVGSWRPRQSGKSLRLAVRPWRKLSAAVHKGVTEQAERLAAYRGVSLGGVDLA